VTRPWDDTAAFRDAEKGDAGSEFHPRLVRPAVERLLGQVAGRRVLDVACGNGIFARRLTELAARVNHARA
jgi:2-polyprenyl-3-methyl-5-hydroxy-6-metoxy-1,4-benzoquinol methylase